MTLFPLFTLETNLLVIIGDVRGTLCGEDSEHEKKKRFLVDLNAVKAPARLNPGILSVSAAEKHPSTQTEVGVVERHKGCVENH